VETIEDWAFEQCSSLEAAVFLGSQAPSMGSEVFSGGHADGTVYFFEGSTGYTAPPGPWAGAPHTGYVHALEYAADDDQGSLTGVSFQVVRRGTSGTAVTAVPNTGYHFVAWSDGLTTATRTDKNVIADKYVTAYFAINTYTLTYKAGPNGVVSGESPQAVDHGSFGTAVTAVPNRGYRFVGWSDGVMTATRTDTNVIAAKVVTANFASLCSLTLTAPATSEYASAKLDGYLKDSTGKALPYKPVEIWVYANGWKKEVVTYTNSLGYYSKTMAPTIRTRYQTRFPGDARYLATSSPERAVLPKFKLTRASSWGTKYRGKSYTYVGYIYPTGTSVRFKMYKKGSDGEYHYKKTVTAYSSPSTTRAKWSAKVSFPSRGKWRVRAYCATSGWNYQAYSSYDYVTVK